MDDQGPVAYYDVTAKTGAVGIVPGILTPVLGYNGIVPAKRIDVEQGTRIVLTMRNKLPTAHPTFGTPMDISTHLHGSASLPQYDGYASDVTAPGQKKIYQYPNFQAARTLWYHDHGVHYTAQNAYSGLASQYHLHDPMERALLPQGEFDVAITLSDMMFAANGSQLYDDRSHSGLWGDVILVNGRPWPVMKVKKRDLPFPFPECVAVPVLSAHHLAGGADVHGRHGRRADAEIAGGDGMAARQRRTLRGADRLLEVQDRPTHRAEEPVQSRTTGISTTPTRSWRST